MHCGLFEIPQRHIRIQNTYSWLNYYNSWKGLHTFGNVELVYAVCSSFRQHFSNILFSIRMTSSFIWNKLFRHFLSILFCFAWQAIIHYMMSVSGILCVPPNLYHNLNIDHLFWGYWIVEASNMPIRMNFYSKQPTINGNVHQYYCRSMRIVTIL